MIIKQTFEVHIPDAFLHDDIVTPTVQDWEYIGDDFIYAYVDKETNIPSISTITEEQFNDGRPVPLDKYVVKIDAVKDPIIASLLCGPNKQDNDFETNRPPAGILIDSHPDYGDYVIHSKYHISEIFNINSITYNPEEQRWNYDVIHYTDLLNVEELTWDMLRKKRDVALKATDGKESGDMPQWMIDELRTYRQKLRDWPSAMADKDVWIVYNLFPSAPSWL